MSDVSKFNVIYKNFENSGDYAAFLLKYGVNYAYIRLGGRGYGNEGKFYIDPNYEMFIEACEYLEMPYGFYYIDEAITDEELDEEAIDALEKYNKYLELAREFKKPCLYHKGKKKVCRNI